MAAAAVPVFCRLLFGVCCCPFVCQLLLGVALVSPDLLGPALLLRVVTLLDLRIVMVYMTWCRRPWLQLADSPDLHASPRLPYVQSASPRGRVRPGDVGVWPDGQLWKRDRRDTACSMCFRRLPLRPGRGRVGRVMSTQLPVPRGSCQPVECHRGGPGCAAGAAFL